MQIFTACAACPLSSQAVVGDAGLQQVDAGLDLAQLQVFVRLVRAVNGAGPHNDSFHTHGLQERSLGGKANGQCAVSGELFRQAHQLAVCWLFEGWHRLYQ